MSTPSQLTLYNRALRILGEAQLSSLTENRPVRNVLDGAWADNFVKSALEQGLWNFAIRTRMATYDPAVEPDFGYKRAFEKPSDWVRTAALCSDEYLREPVLAYSDEAGYWFTDLDTIYVSYVSDDVEFGLNYALWPETFTEFAAYHLAMKAAPTVVRGERRLMMLEKKHRDARLTARSSDAMASPPQMPATGSFVRARRGASGRLDRGNRGSLTG